MLTEAGIRKAIAGAIESGKKVELRDGGERGSGRLMLVARPRDKRVTSEWYALSYRGHVRRAAKIGSYPAMALSEARKLFREQHAPHISAGGLPRGARARAVTMPKDATLCALKDDYLASLAGRPAAAKAAQHLGRAVKRIGPDKAAGAVTTEDIIDVLSVIHGRGAISSASAARAYLRAMFEHGIKGEHNYTRHGAVKSWGIAFNPVSKIPADAEARRVGKRHLTPVEWVTFYRWLEEKTSVAAVALRVILLTGQRVTEITAAGTDQYDSEERLLTWAETKNGMPHVLPLIDHAVHLIHGMARKARGGFLFPAPGGDKPIGVQAVERLVKAFLAENEIPHFTPRDLRRTWKTLAGAAGLSKEIRDRLQNHARSDVSARHYDRWEMMPEKRAAAEMWEAYVVRMIGGA